MIRCIRASGLTEIETRRLVLRPLRPDDAPAYHAIEADPEVKKFVGDVTTRSVDYYRARFANAPHPYTFAVVRKQDGRFIGRCGFTENALVEGWEINIVLAEDVWRLGFAREIGTVLLAHGFQILGATTIFGVADAENHASIALCRKLSMQPQPQFSFRKNGRPVCVYAAFAPASNRSPAP
jgi:ribosomal-protein-alanine N-acetyltransferase